MKKKQRKALFDRPYLKAKEIKKDDVFATTGNF